MLGEAGRGAPPGVKATGKAAVAVATPLFTLVVPPT
jgi:hypothetical protein